MRTAAVLAVLGLWFAAARATAAEYTNPADVPYEPGNVIVRFDGGDVGANMAKVLIALGDIPDALNVTSHRIDRSETPCRVMTSMGFPPACDALKPLLGQLNPGLKSRKLSVGTSVNLPNLKVYLLRSARSYAQDDATQSIAALTLLNNWKTKSPRQQANSAETRINFDAYEIVLQTKSDEQAQAVMKRLAPLRSANIRFDPIWVKPRATKSFSSWTDAEVRNECEHAGLASTRQYRDLSDYDTELVGKLDPWPANTTPRVFVVDEPLDSSPNLVAAVASGATSTTSAAAWTCRWGDFKPSLNHATHMAGIIASKSHGFEGLAPSVQIVAVPWLVAEDQNALAIRGDGVRNLGLSIQQEEGFGQSPRNVWLMASEFPPTSLLLDHGQLADPSQRANESPASQIHDYLPLFIVAAGQADRARNEMPAHLSERYPIGPENLGDWENVVVVGACEVCRRHGVRLWGNSAYSDITVQVAAPGGLPIPGWISQHEVGAAAGTSQSAAYVAGVAAAMVGRHPVNYPSARFIKERLQTTAWPILDGVEGAPGDFARVAVGIVDPLLAQLDPQKHWIKDVSGWRAIRLKGEVSVAGFSDANGDPPPIVPRSVRRIVRVKDGPSPVFAILTLDVPPKAMVRRHGPLRLSGQAGFISTCDGPVQAQDLYDLVIAIGGVRPNEC
jgi:hypothetical protein